MRPGSNTEGIRPADANTARNMPAVNRNAAIAPCAWRTKRCTSSEWDALPNSETVAIAPCTTSIRMMKMKNRISAVEQPKNPQKILRAKASRKVSRTSARVTAMVLLFMNRLHENVFERTAGAGHGFDLTMLGAHQIDSLVGFIAAAEQKFDIAVALGHGHGFSAQFLFDALGHMLRFHAVAAARSQSFDLAFERDSAAMNDGHVMAE